MNNTFQRPRPHLVDIFSSLLLVGLQSFGGGSSTFSLIHQLALQRGWWSEEEFVQAWALSQMAPGINLIKLTVMLGYRLGGWPGLIAATTGLLLPSAGVTVLMTAGFSTIRTVSWVQATMKGILPAAIGISLAMSIQMAHPIFLRAFREGPARLGVHVFILASAALLIGLARLSPVIILLASGLVAIGLFGLTPVYQPVQVTPEDSG